MSMPNICSSIYHTELYTNVFKYSSWWMLSIFLLSVKVQCDNSGLLGSVNPIDPKHEDSFTTNSFDMNLKRTKRNPNWKFPNEEVSDYSHLWSPWITPSKRSRRLFSNDRSTVRHFMPSSSEFNNGADGNQKLIYEASNLEKQQQNPYTNSDVDYSEEIGNSFPKKQIRDEIKKNPKYDSNLFMKEIYGDISDELVERRNKQNTNAEDDYVGQIFGQPSNAAYSASEGTKLDNGDSFVFPRNGMESTVHISPKQEQQFSYRKEHTIDEEKLSEQDKPHSEDDLAQQDNQFTLKTSSNIQNTFDNHNPALEGRSLNHLSAPPHGPIRPHIHPYTLSWLREGRMRSKQLSQRIQKRQDKGHDLLEQVTEFGINETNYLIRIHEPSLYNRGYQLSGGHPGQFLAAFNRQKSESLALSRFGYAALRASERLSRQFKLSRQQALFGLEQVNVENTALFSACPFKTTDNEAFRRPCPAYSVMYRTLDGSCNNADHPEWGAALRPFARFLPPDYSDGIEKLRVSTRGGALPNPRKISTTVHRPLNRPSKRLTMMVMQWGQFLDHDLTATAQSRGFNNSVPRCCSKETGAEVEEEDRHPDCMPIEISPSDNFYSNWNQTCMEFLRSSPAPRPNCGLGPRDQINQVTAFLDASNVYGSDDHEMAQLRLWEGGMLRYKPVRFRKPLLPALHRYEEGECRENSRNLHCFHAGDLRVNEQPALASMHTVWLREHNRLVTELADINKHWNDDRLFFEARKIVAATMQKITYGEWLPTVLGPTVMKVFRLPLQKYGYYRGYKASVNPTITNAVAAAAFRFGHSLVQHSLPRCDKKGKKFPFTIKLHQELMNPSNIHNFGSVDRLMLGMAFENSQSRDVYMTDELTKRLFQTPSNHFGMDLASINIQRGRDHGLPAYNVWREQCGLHGFSNWGELLKVMDDDTVGRLAAAYSTVDDIDLFTGGLAEKPVIYGLVGPTFACILGQQFLNLRRGDRFWFENGGMVSSLTLDQLKEVRKASLARVLCDNLDDVDQLQPNVFRPFTNDSRNHMQDCHTLPGVNLTKWKEQIDEDFQGFHYTGWPLNFSNLTPHGHGSKDEAEEKEDQIDISQLKETDLYFIEDEESLRVQEKEFIEDGGYTNELPLPFIFAPGDEVQHIENDLRYKENEFSGYLSNRGPSTDLTGKLPPSERVRRPLVSKPGMSALTDHNYNNVMEHAYANTLFYRRHNP